jgi:c-di-AMP phosphodiesterase-like protein
VLNVGVDAGVLTAAVLAWNFENKLRMETTRCAVIVMIISSISSSSSIIIIIIIIIIITIIVNNVITIILSLLLLLLFILLLLVTITTSRCRLAREMAEARGREPYKLTPEMKRQREAMLDAIIIVIIIIVIIIIIIITIIIVIIIIIIIMTIIIHVAGREMAEARSREPYKLTPDMKRQRETMLDALELSIQVRHARFHPCCPSPLLMQRCIMQNQVIQCAL